MLRLLLVIAAALLVALDAAAQVQVVRPGMPPRDAGAAAPQTGTSRIRGRVFTADTRAPLRRARVTLISPEASVRRTTTTDPEGRYEFAELPAGRYIISANKGGYVTLQAGQRRPFEPGTPLALADGQTLTNVDVALPRGSVITGRVTDEFGEPLAAAQVQALRYQYGPGGRRQLSFAGAPFVQTDDLGQFRLYGLMPGEYVVSASLRQFGAAMGGGNAADTSEGFAPTYYPGTSNPAEAEPVIVSLGQELTVHIPLTAARMARVSGTVVNADGRPAAGGMIMLRSGSGAAAMASMMNGQVGPDGAFTLANVPPGEHTIEVRPMMPGAGRGEFASMTLTVGTEDVRGVRITTSAGASVSGRVVFEGTAPRTGGMGPLRVFPQAADPQVFGVGMMLGGAGNNGLIADDGTFAIDGVSGSVLFRVSAPPAWTIKSVTIDGEDVTDVAYDFKGAQSVSDVRIVLTDKLTEVSGRVTDDRNQPLKEYVVVLLPEEAREGFAATRYTRTVRPDQEGVYRLRGLPPGRYAAAAVTSLEQGGEWDPEFQRRLRQAADSVTLREGQATTLDLKLAGGL